MARIKKDGGFDKRFTKQIDVYEYEQQEKSRTTAILLCIFLGVFGIHRMYLGYRESSHPTSIIGIIEFITGGVFLIWALIDFNDFVNAVLYEGFTTYAIIFLLALSLVDFIRLKTGLLLPVTSNSSKGIWKEEAEKNPPLKEDSDK